MNRLPRKIKAEGTPYTDHVDERLMQLPKVVVARREFFYLLPQDLYMFRVLTEQGNCILQQVT